MPASESHSAAQTRGLYKKLGHKVSWGQYRLRNNSHFEQCTWVSSLVTLTWLLGSNPASSVEPVVIPPGGSEKCAEALSAVHERAGG